MAKDQHVSFDFSDEDRTEREFLSGRPLPPQSAAPAKSKRGRKPLKSTGEEEEPVVLPEDDVLFAKAYWSIREVSEMFKVPLSQVRYWEKEFDVLEPRKNRKGDRYFRPVDVKNLQLIHDLIRRRKFTVEGAREYLRKNAKAKEKHEMIAALQKLRTFLVELRANT